MKLTFALVSVVQFVTDDLVAVVVVVTVVRDASADAVVFVADDSCRDLPIRTRRLLDRCRQSNRFAVDDCCSLKKKKTLTKKLEVMNSIQFNPVVSGKQNNFFKYSTK